MKYMQSIVKFVLISSLVTSCTNGNQDLVLSTTEITKANEVDTIEAFPERRMYFVNIITNRAFGHFSMNYGIIKMKDRNDRIVYKVKGKKDEEGRVSKDFIAFVKISSGVNWGWFNRQNGALTTDLPNIKEILDSLKSTVPDNVYIKETNGNISFLVDGKRVKSLSYGECVSKLLNLSINNLPYNLYKFQGGALTPIADNGDDLFVQKDGIFFIPSPGYGVIRKFSKLEVINIVDSMSKLEFPPSTIRIRPLK